MGIHARTADYRIESGLPIPADDRARSPLVTPLARTTGRPETDGSLEFLQLLARAVQQHHTYPPTSPLCRSAIEACQRALVQLRREELTFRVAPHELIVDEAGAGRGTIVEQELARRLHAAAIAQVSFGQSVSLRELAHFCNDLLACSQRTKSDAGLIERLAEHGVDHITLKPAYRPEVLDVAPPPQPVSELIALQRQQRDQMFAAGGPVDHLYPPDKGWVRLDPSAHLPSVSLIDLALLAEDPEALAAMLIRLTDDDVPEDAEGSAALSQKFSDVATLFSALEPRVARVMFAKLARAVLDLDPDRRQALLRRTILPSLLDGRIDGTVLRDFPDLDLAEALCLLLDLETASPELVTSALARLELTSERESAVIPLIEGQLHARGVSETQDPGLDSHARRLIRIDHGKRRNLAEFTAYDLALDGAAEQTLTGIRDAIAATDVVVDQLACLFRLINLEPNPEYVERFARRAQPLLEDLEVRERWSELAGWASRLRGMSTAMREARPDVADVLNERLKALCTPRRAAKLVALAGGGGLGKRTAGELIEALGPEIARALLEASHSQSGDGKDTRAKTALQLLSDHAKLVAPVLVELLPQADATAARTIARVLGLAGPGYEAALGQQLGGKDQQTIREALRSLARIGTAHAAALVSAQVLKRRDWVAGAAEEALWHLPAGVAQREVRQLLMNRDFIAHRPDVAARLLDRVAQSGTSGLEPVLQAASPLRYRFWNPAQMRLGRKACALLNR